MSTKTNIPETQNAAVGPAVDDLKAQFSERSIPLESDFADLIDIADCGRRAVGLSPEQTPNTASGLVLDNDGQLVVQPAPAKGIEVVTSGVGVVANTEAGIKVDDRGVGINIADGLIITNQQLDVNYNKQFLYQDLNSDISGWYRIITLPYPYQRHFAKMSIEINKSIGVQCFTLDLCFVRNTYYAVTLYNSIHDGIPVVDYVRLSIDNVYPSGCGIDLHFIGAEYGHSINISYSPFDVTIKPTPLVVSNGSELSKMSATVDGHMNSSPVLFSEH